MYAHIYFQSISSCHNRKKSGVKASSQSLYMHPGLTYRRGTKFLKQLGRFANSDPNTFLTPFFRDTYTREHKYLENLDKCSSDRSQHKRHNRESDGRVFQKKHTDSCSLRPVPLVRGPGEKSCCTTSTNTYLRYKPWSIIIFTVWSFVGKIGFTFR